MRLYCILLAALLTSSDAMAELDQTKILSVVPTATVNSIVSERRFLRVDKSADISRYSLNNEDNTDGDSEVKKLISNDVEERAGGDGALKMFNGVVGDMTKGTSSFSEKLVSALPIKLKLRVWSKNEKPLGFIENKLGLDQLTDAAFKEAKSYKLYDDYVTSQLAIWTKKGLSTDDVLVRLGLNTLAGAARTDSVNFKYYEEFVVIQMRIWMKNDLPLDDVMAKLKLDKLSGNKLLSHPNYKYYKNFVTNKLKSWATDGVRLDDVQIRLGLEKLRGRALETHPNYTFLEKYIRKLPQYREEGWLKQKLSTYDIWQKLEVYRVHPNLLRSSNVYKVYKNYVNTMDDYIIDLVDSGFTAPNMISKDASEVERQTKTFIWISAKRPEWYVRYSLGLDGLEGVALQEAANYQFLKRYLQGIKFVK